MNMKEKESKSFSDRVFRVVWIICLTLIFVTGWVAVLFGGWILVDEIKNFAEISRLLKGLFCSVLFILTSLISFGLFAVHIYWEKLSKRESKVCEYCDKNKTLLNCGVGLLKINKGKLGVEYFSDEKPSLNKGEKDTLEINLCPMCGKRLKRKQKKPKKTSR